MKAVLASSLVAGLILGMTAAPATPAVAQQHLTAQILDDVCLPYANRSKSFEKAIRAARDLQFRRPANERGQVLEEYASEINLVSQDGAWRVRLEEGSVPVGDVEAYAVTCTLSSTRASARELADLGRRAFRNEQYWTTDQTAPNQWDRRVRNPDERRLEVRVVEDNGQRPALTIRGLYF